MVETALQASHLTRLRAKKPPHEGETWDFRVQVADAREGEIGEGIVLVRGVDGKGWVLLGKGTEARSEAGVGGEARVEARTGGEMRAGWMGSEIQIRKPVWEVELLSEKWTVGVEWELLYNT